MISIMVISFMVFVLRKGGIISQEYDNQRADQELAKFNSQFELYDKSDNNIFDVITVSNLVWDENTKNGNDPQNEIILRINLNSSGTKFYEIKNGCKKNNFLDQNNNQVYFYDAKHNGRDTGDILVNSYDTARDFDGRYIVKYNYLFDCKSIEYNTITGKVKKIIFELKNV